MSSLFSRSRQTRSSSSSSPSWTTRLSSAPISTHAGRAAPSSQDSVYGVAAVQSAIDQLAVDLTSPENLSSWQALAAMQPGRSRIELFDMVWWMYFRELERLSSPLPHALTFQWQPLVLTRPRRRQARSIRSYPANAAAEGEVARFQDDDDGYLRWLGMHPGGLVVNCGRQPRAD